MSQCGNYCTIKNSNTYSYLFHPFFLFPLFPLFQKYLTRLKISITSLKLRKNRKKGKKGKAIYTLLNHLLIFGFTIPLGISLCLGSTGKGLITTTGLLENLESLSDHGLSFFIGIYIT